MQYEVVVAEDEELLLKNLTGKINAFPAFRVVGEAQTGKRALELVRELMPSLLITDIRMPVMDGIELLTHARDAFPDMKFIIISGFSDFEYAREAIQLKVFDYLLKPVSQTDINDVLEKLTKTLALEQEDYANYFAVSPSKVSSLNVAKLLHDFISAHYAMPLNLNEIAQMMNYSASYLSKAFQQEYGCSPIRFLGQVRLQHACHLLVHQPELTVNQIAELTGYEDQGYFSRSFKKAMEISPLQYRKLQRGL